MPYPVVLAYKNDEFARINADGNWSVLWDKAETVSEEVLGTTAPYIQNKTTAVYEKISMSSNKAIVALARSLMAARDTLDTISWETSNEWADKWERKSYTIDIDESENARPFCIPLIMKYNQEIVAQINPNGEWEINWDLIDDAILNSNKKSAGILVLLKKGSCSWPLARTVQNFTKGKK
jgi:hypothetical protein